jgi:subtilisin family serine protease
MIQLFACLLFIGTTFGLCEQGSGFDPNLKLVVSAVQTVPGDKPARVVLGTESLTKVCRDLEVAGKFRCVSVWSTGMSGYAMSDNSIVAEVQKRLPDSASTLRLSLDSDIYYENPVGMRSPPTDEPPQCSRNLREVYSRKLGTVQGPPPPPGCNVTCGDPSGPKVQTGAEDTLSFLSAYDGPPGCFPNCQTKGEFRYATSGKGVTVYVVDQAVLATHDDFVRQDGTRAVSADRYYSPVAAVNNASACGAWHGTHVAGLAAGNVYGVAKDAKVVSVAVQPGCQQDGRVSDLISGLDWVLTHHEKNGKGPAIVSMSLIVVSSGAGSVLEGMVRDLIDAGIVVVVAAGNFADDACNYMPANLEDVITVAAAQLDTVRGVSYASAWASTNVGECVTVWAPGAYVKSASSDSDEATAVYSGTSQATPMVSGLVAHFLERYPKATPLMVRQHLLNTSVAGALSRVPLNTKDRFAQVAI